MVLSREMMDKLAILFFCLLQAQLTSALLNNNNNQQRQLQPVPPPPQTNGLFKLSQMSPASALLANEFFANERLKNVPQSQQATRALVSHMDRQESQFASSAPVFSKALPSLQFRLDKYHSLEEIDAYLEALQDTFPRKVSLFSIGQTFEGRPIKALEIVNNKTESDLVWLDALTHAREWVTGSTIIYIIDQILAPSQSSSIVQFKNYIIIPVVNPDGYAYTWSTNRMWRKNRSKPTTPNSNCLGVSKLNILKPIAMK